MLARSSSTLPSLPPSPGRARLIDTIALTRCGAERALILVRSWEKPARSTSYEQGSLVRTLSRTRKYNRFKAIRIRIARNRFHVCALRTPRGVAGWSSSHRADLAARPSRRRSPPLLFGSFLALLLTTSDPTRARRVVVSREMRDLPPSAGMSRARAQEAPVGRGRIAREQSDAKTIYLLRR